MCHSFLIHSSADGRLGWPHFFIIIVIIFTHFGLAVQHVGS